MDVNQAGTAIWQQTLAQAHVDPEKGRKGDFEHWQRIFDAQGQPTPLPTETGGRASQDRIAPELTASSASLRLQPGVVLSSRWAPVHGEEVGSARPLSSASAPSRASGGQGLAVMHAPSPLSARSDPLQSKATESPRATQKPAQTPHPPDARPLSQIEAHLSRSAEGRVNVTLRSSQPLSATQALMAVAEALTAQGCDTPVDEVRLNGQPIYRATSPSTPRFEIDC